MNSSLWIYSFFHRKVLRLTLGSLSLALLLSCDAKPVDELPELTDRVMDLADIIPAAQETRIRELLKRHEEATTDQVVVLTIESLEGLAVEDYSMRVVEKWQIGQKDKDNGVLLLVAKNDRKVRIEVGYGLEGQLTDLYSSRIIRERIVPEFKAGNFGEGVLYGVTGILYRLDSPVASEASNELATTGSFSGTVVDSPGLPEVTSTETQTGAEEESSEPTTGTSRSAGDWASLIFGGVFALGGLLFILWMVQYFARAMLFAEGLTGWVFLIAIGWLGPFLAASILTPVLGQEMGSPITWVLLAVFMGGLIGIRLLFQKTEWGKDLSEKWVPDMSSSGSYSGGYSSSSSGGWSSSSSGGFSGGGGSFGGGGASGSW